MTESPEYWNLQKIIPDLTRAESETLRYYWRVYWENPAKYAKLKQSVIEWLRNGEGKVIVEKREKSMRW